jgi:hypothetical protein
VVCHHFGIHAQEWWECVRFKRGMYACTTVVNLSSGGPESRVLVPTQVAWPTAEAMAWALCHH